MRLKLILNKRMSMKNVAHTWISSYSCVHCRQYFDPIALSCQCLISSASVQPLDFSSTPTTKPNRMQTSNKQRNYRAVNSLPLDKSFGYLIVIRQNVTAKHKALELHNHQISTTPTRAKLPEPQDVTNRWIIN